MKRMHWIFVIVICAVLSLQVLAQVGKKGEEKPAANTSTTKESTPSKKSSTRRNTRSTLASGDPNPTVNDTTITTPTIIEPSNIYDGVGGEPNTVNYNDTTMLYNRGIAEYKAGKVAEAEQSFNAAIKVNPKDAASLFYRGRIAFERHDFDTAISSLNRATVNDSGLAPAWALLTISYLRRAAVTTVEKANADYLGAVRAGENLTRAQAGVQATTLYAYALISARQFVRAAELLEQVTTGDDSKGSALYLLGVAHSRSKNFSRAIAALKRAVTKSSEDVNVYRELGYNYEVSKQYSKALDVYQRGAQLAPNDSNLKEAIERVKQFAK